MNFTLPHQRLDREALLGIARAELAELEAELRRRVHLEQPGTWAWQRCQVELWSFQERILRSVQENRYTAAITPHGVGKSFAAALAAVRWVDTHRPGEAFVVTSAPTNPQVKAILWRYINRLHGSGPFPGRTNQTEWYVEVIGRDGSSGEELVAFGRKPADADFAAFQGIHAPYVLIIFDEAVGMPKLLFDASKGLMTGDDCRMLAISNPDLPESHFAKLCKPGSGWNIISINAFQTPAFSGEAVSPKLLKQLVNRDYVEDCRREWAPDWKWNEAGTLVLPPDGETFEDAFRRTDPFWASKVWGKFPHQSGPQVLIPDHWIIEAQERSLPQVGANELGVDVGAGGDSSTTAHRRGGWVRILSEDHNPDTMQTAGKVKKEREATAATKVKIDANGIGKGAYDRLLEQNEPVVSVMVGRSPDCTCEARERRDSRHDRTCDTQLFANLRAQLWWRMRARFEEGKIDIDPDDLALAQELGSMRYKRNSSGKIQIESKDEARRRGVRSPNRADAAMHAFAEIDEELPIEMKEARFLW